MKKIETNQLENFTGGCMRWMRRYDRAIKNGIDDEEYLDSLRWGFRACIDQKYE